MVKARRSESISILYGNHWARYVLQLRVLATEIQTRSILNILLPSLQKHLSHRDGIAQSLWNHRPCSRLEHRHCTRLHLGPCDFGKPSSAVSAQNIKRTTRGVPLATNHWQYSNLRHRSFQGFLRMPSQGAYLRSPK